MSFFKFLKLSNSPFCIVPDKGQIQSDKRLAKIAKDVSPRPHAEICLV